MDFFVSCPACSGLIVINQNEINCGIFRHLVEKKTGNSIPHASKVEVETLLKTGVIWGCGSPFELVKKGNEFKAQTCEFK